MSRLKYSTQRRILIFAFLIIPITLLVTFSYLPLANLFYYSTTSWNGLSKVKEFIGVDNYVRLFTDPKYFEVFKVSLYYLVGSFIQLGVALYFATVLSFKVKAKNFFKGAIFFPYLINGVAIALIFRVFFQSGGTLDSVLELIGLGNLSQQWLLDTKINNIALAGVSVWRYMGFNFIIFLGAMQSIGSEIYEAADIDGANKWQKFRYIILPSIRRIIELNLILSISGAIAVFDIPYIMLHGSNGTGTFVIQTVNMAFETGKLGLASSMAVVLLFIVVFVTIIQRVYFAIKKED
ncbi:MAG: sugar ABC transporter permease [Vallitaleaceae bacterium]|jgi:ABC-type sugar transport system permease subunit|nr:sugar ABC transporter permease [Vallitaleaceae bacterium]